MQQVYVLSTRMPQMDMSDCTLQPRGAVSKPSHAAVSGHTALYALIMQQKSAVTCHMPFTVSSTSHTRLNRLQHCAESKQVTAESMYPKQARPAALAMHLRTEPWSARHIQRHYLAEPDAFASLLAMEGCLATASMAVEAS